MISVYLYSKCSTCKDAENFLKQQGIAFQKKEIVTQPPSLQELKQMLVFQNGQLKKLFNTSGLLYKEMELSQKLLHFSTEEALTLLSKNGMLVKRPFLLGIDFGLVGFQKQAWLNLNRLKAG